MKSQSTTHKAEELGKRSEIQNCVTTQFSSVPQFANEEQFLHGLKSFMQAGRESRTPGVARIARQWERIINYRILLTQQERKRREAVRAKRVALKLSVSVSTSTDLGPEGNGAPGLRRP